MLCHVLTWATNIDILERLMVQYLARVFILRNIHYDLLNVVTTCTSKRIKEKDRIYILQLHLQLCKLRMREWQKFCNKVGVVCCHGLQQLLQSKSVPLH